MFLRTRVKAATSELVNLATAVCITHRRWHDTDDHIVTACFTPERVVQDTMILTRPMSQREAEDIIELISGALSAGTPVLDLQEYGDKGAGHEAHRHAVHHTGAH